MVGTEDAAAVMDAVWNVANELEDFRPWSRNDSEMEMVVNFLTKAMWLDRIELQFTKQGSSTKVRVKNCSTGLIPCIIPGAPLMNVLLAPAPFLDWGKLASTMKYLQKKTAEKLGTEITREIVFVSLGNPCGSGKTDKEEQ